MKIFMEQVVYQSFCNEFIDDTGILIEKLPMLEKIPLQFQHPNHKELLSYARATSQITPDLKNAVKFKIPAANQILLPRANPIEAAKQFIDEVNLPFPVIAIEVEAMTLYESQCNDFIVMATQEGDLIRIYTMWREHGAWNTPDSDDGVNTLSYVQLNRKTFEVDMVGFDLNRVTEERKRELIDFVFVVHIRVILNLVCVLSCSNAQIEDYDLKPSRLKQDRRKKKGKLPLFEFKVLTISSETTGSTSGKAGSHNSPRVHLRRGHIRKLPTKNVWVNACVVGDKAKGVIQKDYLVKS